MISCLCPTFNRYPRLGFLLEEAVESFLRQDHAEKELLILNDTPGQRLAFDHRQVRIFNAQRRLPDLSAKIQYLIDRAAGDVFCRWDDDDLSLPWRLSYSLAKLGDRLEWRPENFWFVSGADPWKEDHFPGNSHVAAIFNRAALTAIGGRYPAGFSGGEDLTFNRLLTEAGHPPRGELLPTAEMFYAYRWGTGSEHLSGISDGSSRPHQAHWDALGKRPIVPGKFTIRPHWRRDYLACAQGFSTS
jgi:hypothetical protein